MSTIYDSIKIGNIEIKNRLAVAATVKNLAEQDGRVNMRNLYNYGYEADGPGLYMVSMTYTEDQGRVFRGQTGIQDDLAVYGMDELASRIRKAGSVPFLQLSHGGNLCSEGIIGELPVGPSSIAQWQGQTVRTLTTEEVEKIIDNFGIATMRAKQAGFDGVEFHACHGSMMLQFLSPIHNQGRTDRFSNPPQFTYECVEKAREYVGEDYVLGVRFSCHEFMEEDLGKPGLVFDNVKEYAKELEKMGINYIHASAGRIGHTPDHSFPPLYEPRGVNLKFAAELKKILKIPVVTVGRFQDAKIIKKAVEDGKADIVAMCRPVIADPFISKKILEGKEDEIRKCMGCNWCLDRLFSQVGVECPMNPAYGWEKEYALIPTDTPKEIMVIGGGIAGMQAALAASARGHRVKLYESSGQLGGQVKYSSQFPGLYTRELWNLPKWLINEVEKSAIDIHLNTAVGSDLIDKVRPDTIIVATGAKEKRADLTIQEGSNVISLWEYLCGAEVGKNVIVFGDESIEAAASLCNDGKKVTLLQEGEDYNWPHYVFAGAARREPLLRYISKAKVVFNSSVKSIKKDIVTINSNGKNEELKYDTIIDATGREKVDNLFTEYKSKGYELFVIGDAKDVRNMTPATHEGYWVGRIV